MKAVNKAARKEKLFNELIKWAERYEAEIVKHKKEEGKRQYFSIYTLEGCRLDYGTLTELHRVHVVNKTYCRY